jgi:chromosome segregation ATPase
MAKNRPIEGMDPSEAHPMRVPGIMRFMGRVAALAFCLVAACAHRNELNLLEREKLQFRAENEKIRAEDLEERYLQQKRKADQLSSELLALERDRDRLYTEYDLLRGETVRLERDVKVAGERRDGLTKALGEAKAEAVRLQAELEAERKAVADIEEQLRTAQAKHAALVSTGQPATE